MDSARERVLRFELEPRIRHRTPGTRVATCQGGCPPRRRSRSSHESAHRLLVGFGIACHAPGTLLAIRARATNPPPDSRNPKIELKLSTYATSPHAHLGIAIRPLRPARCLAGVATAWIQPGSVCCDSSSNHESAFRLPARMRVTSCQTGCPPRCGSHLSHEHDHRRLPIPLDWRLRVSAPTSGTRYTSAARRQWASRLYIQPPMRPLTNGKYENHSRNTPRAGTAVRARATNAPPDSQHAK